MTSSCDKQKANGITIEIYQELLKLKKIKTNHTIKKNRQRYDLSQRKVPPKRLINGSILIVYEIILNLNFKTRRC